MTAYKKEEVYKVIALTLDPDFRSFYSVDDKNPPPVNHTDTYKPSEIGEWGYMEESAALEARGKCWVALFRDLTPVQRDAMPDVLPPCEIDPSVGRVFCLGVDPMSDCGIPEGLNWAGRASVTTFVDAYGLVKEIPADCLAMPGYRLESNIIYDSDHPYSEDLSQWFLNNAALPTFREGYGWLIGSDPVGSAATVQCQDVYRDRVAVGDTVTVRVLVGNDSFVGGLLIRIREYQGGTYLPPQQDTVITNPVHGETYTLTVTCAQANVNNLRIVMGVEAGYTGNLYLNKASASIVTGRSNQNPPGYVSVGVESAPMYHGAGVDGYKYFSTTNGNTVNPDGSINEAVGSALPGPLRLRLEPAATNYYFASFNPAGRVTALTDGNQYTLSMKGSGSVDLLGGATGAATEGAPFTFTQSGSTVNVTPNGDVQIAQIEDGPIATSFIETTDSAAATRAADAPLQWPLTTPQDEGMVIVEGEIGGGLGGIGVAFINFREAITGPLYSNLGASYITMFDVTNSARTDQITQDPEVTEVLAARWNGATPEMQAIRMIGSGWNSRAPAPYDGGFSSTNLVVVGYGLTAPLFIKSASVYDVDNGQDFIEGNWPT